MGLMDKARQMADQAAAKAQETGGELQEKAKPSVLD
jgi:hypothetical protein